MTQRRKNHKNRSSGLSPKLWSATPALEQIWRLNEHFLNVTAEAARAGRSRALFVVQHRELWLALDAQSCAAAARHSVLLIETDLHSEEIWRTVIQERRLHRPEMAGFLSTRRAQELLRETLVVAWPLAREDRVAARALFGMAEEVASLVASLSAPQIDRIAERYSTLVRPRWETRTGFWADVLRGGESGELQALRKVHAYGFQLLGGGLLASA